MEDKEVIETPRGKFSIIEQTENYTIYGMDVSEMNEEEKLQDLAWMVYEEDWGPEAFIREGAMRGVDVPQMQRVMLKFGSSELLRKSVLFREILI